MLTIRLRNQNAQVLFQQDSTILRLDKHGFEPVQKTSCLILGENNTPIAVGHSVKSSLDDDNDFKGMELSLGRALQMATPDKTERRKVWDAFYHAVSDELIADVRETILANARIEQLDVAPEPDDAEWNEFITAIDNSNVTGAGGTVLQFPAPVNPRIAELERELAEAVLMHSNSRLVLEQCPICNSWVQELNELRAAA